jgi:hypothetical protein
MPRGERMQLVTRLGDQSLCMSRWCTNGVTVLTRSSQRIVGCSVLNVSCSVAYLISLIS